MAGGPTIQQFVKWGLDRDVAKLLAPEACTPECKLHLNLGPGNVKVIEGTTGLGRLEDALTEIEWDAREPLPYEDETVHSIHAHHFLEHLTGDEAIGVLAECERVLEPGGVMFITTPYPGTGIFRHALDHKTMWTEETWQWLFSNPYYNGSRRWKLQVHVCFIFGLVERNVCLFTQLVKP